MFFFLLPLPPQGDIKCPPSPGEVLDLGREFLRKKPVCVSLIGWSLGIWQFYWPLGSSNSLMVPRRSLGGQADRGLVGLEGRGGALFDSWLISGLIDRKLWIGWFGTCVCRELVPAPTALAAPSLWCSFLQVHAPTGPSAGTTAALRLVFRQLLGCVGLKREKN